MDVGIQKRPASLRDVFPNGKGGTIVFGVDDKTHKIVGIKKSEVFQKADTIADTIFNSCEPKIRPSINLQEIDKRYIIVVTVPSGMQQPYYIKSLGITEGTFVRVAATTREAERYMLKELVLAQHFLTTSNFPKAVLKATLVAHV